MSKKFLKNFYQPTQIVIDISTSCSASCPFCARTEMDGSRKNNYMELEVFKKILTECQKENIKQINLYQTGEATLHPQFHEFISLAKKLGFEIYLSTNGSHVDKHIKTLLMIDHIRFSIDGWNKQSFELFRYPLKFENIRENLKLLFDERNKSGSHTSIGINTIYSKKADFEAFLNLYGSYIDFLEVSPLFPTTYYDNDKKSFEIKYDDSLKEHYFNFEYMPREKRWCHFPFSTPVISYDGNMLLCCQDFSSSFSLDNIKNGLSNIFNSKEINKIRKEFVDETLTTCQNCYRFLELSQKDKETIQEDVLKVFNKDTKFNHINLSIKV